MIPATMEQLEQVRKECRTMVRKEQPLQPAPHSYRFQVQMSSLTWAC